MMCQTYFKWGHACQTSVLMSDTKLFELSKKNKSWQAYLLYLYVLLDILFEISLVSLHVDDLCVQYT